MHTYQYLHMFHVEDNKDKLSIYFIENQQAVQKNWHNFICEVQVKTI